MASMVSGYLREMVLARTFGAGALADAYLSVMTITRLVCDIGPSAVLLASVVPVMSSLISRPATDRGRVFLVTLVVTGLVTGGMAVGLVLLMPVLLNLLTPGFDAATRDISLAMTNGIVWFLPLQSITILFSLFLNALGRFRAAAAAPVVANGLFIGVLLLPGDGMAVERLWMATLAGPGLSALFLGIEAWRQGLFQSSPSAEANAALGSLWRLARPVLFSLGLAGSAGLLMLCQLLVRRSGSLGGEGNVAALAYAFRIYEVPVSLTANVAATLILPALSRLYADGSSERMTEICRRLLEWGILLLAPMTVVVFLEAPLLVDLLFGYGRFTAADAERTAAALQGFAPAILFEAGIVVFYRVLYALHQTKIALVVSVIVVTSLVIFLVAVPAPDVRQFALAFSGSFAVGLVVLTGILFRQMGRGLLPFSDRSPAILALLTVCALAILLPVSTPLINGASFVMVYGAAFLFLMPAHRGVVISLLSRRNGS